MKDLNTTDLDKAKDAPQRETPRFDLKYFPHSDLLVNSLNEMFPEQAREDKTVLKAKELLGESYSIEEVKSLVASYKYLLNIWLEEYEKKVFDGKTLKELLQSL